MKVGQGALDKCMHDDQGASAAAHLNLVGAKMAERKWLNFGAISAER